MGFDGSLPEAEGSGKFEMFRAEKSTSRHEHAVVRMPSRTNYSSTFGAQRDHRGSHMCSLQSSPRNAGHVMFLRFTSHVVALEISQHSYVATKVRCNFRNCFGCFRVPQVLPCRGPSNNHLVVCRRYIHQSSMDGVQDGT